MNTDDNDFAEFVVETMTFLAKAFGIPYEMLYGSFERTYEINTATAFMRYYAQSGPWAEMLTEG